MRKKFDDCTYCGGRVTIRYIQKPCYWGDRLIAIVDNVPAGVCEQCGEKYYESKVLKAVEFMLKSRKRFKEEVRVPLADFSKISV